VAAFLDEKIGFTDIAALIEQTLERAEITQDIGSLENILQADAMARAICSETMLAKY